MNKRYYKSSKIIMENRNEKLLNEYFNDYGFNLSSQRKDKVNNYDIYSKTSSCNINSIKKSS